MGVEAGSSHNIPIPNPSSVLTSREPICWINVVLLVTALVGWLTFIVACTGGPAWSPDGSKVLFGYYDEEHSRTVIALYDRSTHKTKDLFANLTPKEGNKSDVIVIAPTWQADGSRAIIGMSTDVENTDNGNCTLISIPIKSDAPLQVYDFGGKAVCWTAVMLPQFGDTVYLSGEKDLTWLNLTSGRIDSRSIPDFGGFIAEHNGKLVYMRGISGPAPTADQAAASANPGDGGENRKSHVDGIELGEVNLKDASLRPYFSLWKDDPDFARLKDGFSASWEPGGTRIALVAAGEDLDRVVLVDEKKGVIGRFAPDLGLPKFHLGPLVWSRDGTTLYAPAVLPTEKEDRCTYALAEFSITGSASRLTRIAEFSQNSRDGDEISAMLMLGLQVSLSPDGKTIAASTGTLEDNVDKGSRGLFLIDVAHPEHHITYIPSPHAKAH